MKMPTRRRNKISRRNKKNKIGKKNNQTKRHRGGDKDGPMHPDAPRQPRADELYKQYIKQFSQSVISERIDAGKERSAWQKDFIRDENNPLALNVTIAVPSPYVPTSYSPSPFWDNLFTPEEIQNIIEMLKRPSICDEVVGLLPAFENKPLELIVSPTGVMRNGMMVFSDDKQKQTDDWNERCNVICSTLIILGIISSKMQSTKQDYAIISKGGLSVALMLSQLTINHIKVPVNDLDFKIIPTTKILYVPEHANNLAMHIGALVQHILAQVINKSKGYEMKLLAPSSTVQSLVYKDLVKLSLKPRDSGYIPILDLDFGDFKKSIKYFDTLFDINGELPANAETRFPVRFVHQSDLHMLGEKLYYYAQYFFIKEELNHKQSKMLRASPFGDIQYDHATKSMMHNDTHVTSERCDDFLIKFKKSILLLTNAMIESSKLETSEAFQEFETNPLLKSVVDKDPEYEIFRRMLERMIMETVLKQFSYFGLFPIIAICSPSDIMSYKKNWRYIGNGTHQRRDGILTTDIMCDQIIDPRIVANMIDSLYPRP
jgi:hypothetical protein